jgi:hypothetical protein
LIRALACSAARFLKQYAGASKNDRPVAVPPSEAPAGAQGSQLLLQALDPLLQHLTKTVVKSGAVAGDPKGNVAEQLRDEMARLQEDPVALAAITRVAPAVASDDATDDGSEVGRMNPR